MSGAYLERMCPPTVSVCVVLHVPDRSRAGSRESGRLVAAMTLICERQG